MDSASFSGFTHPDGLHLSVDGIGSMFRFWVGQGEVNKVPGSAAHIWSVKGIERHYLVQLTITPLDPNALKTMDALQLLNGHHQWETGHQRQSGNSAVDETSLKIVDHPLGMPVLSWASDRFALPAPSSDFDHEPPTPYLTMATLVHDGMVVGFGVTGFGSTWEKASLQDLAVRIALSYDRSDPWKAVGPDRSAGGFRDVQSSGGDENQAYHKGSTLSTEGLFELVTDEIFRDGKVDSQENRLALLLAAALGMKEARAKEIAARSKARYDSGKLGDDRPFEPRQLYARVLRYVLSDGKVDPKERKLVEGLLKVLGLTPEDHRRILAGVLADPASILHSVPGTLVKDLIMPAVAAAAAKRAAAAEGAGAAPRPSGAISRQAPVEPVPDPGPQPPPELATPEPEPEPEPPRARSTGSGVRPAEAASGSSDSAQPTRPPRVWADPKKKRKSGLSSDSNPSPGGGGGGATSPMNDLAFVISSAMAFFGFFATLLYYVAGINVFEPGANPGEAEGSPAIFPILTFLSAAFALYRRWALRRDAG